MRFKCKYAFKKHKIYKIIKYLAFFTLIIYCHLLKIFIYYKFRKLKVMMIITIKYIIIMMKKFTI